MGAAVSGYERVQEETSGGGGVFVLEDAERSVKLLEAETSRHAFVVWILLPVFVLVQHIVVGLRPSCDVGFQNITLVGLVVLEVHHLFSERRAWDAVKEMLAPPEVSVMRSLGVLRRRKWTVMLAVAESIALYTWLTFPLVARSCDAEGELTEKWSHAWGKVPHIGGIAAHLIRVVHFYGITLVILLAYVVCMGWVGLVKVCLNAGRRAKLLKFDNGMVERLPGEVFVVWAETAEIAMMASVAMLCQEMASQKRYIFDPQKDSRLATLAREDRVLGLVDASSAQKQELQDTSEAEKMEAAEEWYFAVTLILKVMLGSALQLWLQTSFFALTYDSLGMQAKVKLIICLLASSTEALARCYVFSIKAGNISVGLLVPVFLLLVWTAMKVYAAIVLCEHHVWNFTTGCVGEL